MPFIQNRSLMHPETNYYSLLNKFYSHVSAHLKYYISNLKDDKQIL